VEWGSDGESGSQCRWRVRIAVIVLEGGSDTARSRGVDDELEAGVRRSSSPDRVVRREMNRKSIVSSRRWKEDISARPKYIPNQRIDRPWDKRK